MKPYGNARIENLTCAYGCCTHGTVKTHHRGVAKSFIRRARKRARRENQNVTRQLPRP